MISEAVLSSLIAAVIGSGGIGAVLVFLGKRSSDRADELKAERAEVIQKEKDRAANSLSAEQQNQKNMQDLITALNQQVIALRMQKSEDLISFRADITALSEANSKLETYNDKLKQDAWDSRNQLESYKHCPSPTCPFKITGGT